MFTTTHLDIVAGLVPAPSTAFEQLANRTALAASHSTVQAAGSGLIDMSHWIFYTIVGVGCTYFLAGGILRGIFAHSKKGEGAAFKAILGGVGLAILITHIVGIYTRGNAEIEKAPGGWFNGGGSSVSVPSNRGW